MADAAWIVFDYGEVISLRTKAQPAMAARLGVELAAFAAAYRQERDAYVLGQSDLNYWQAVAARLGATMDERMAMELTRQDIAGWLEVDQLALGLVDGLHRAGIPLALLSNLPRSLARAVERQPWAAAFEHLLFSADLRVAKPDPAIWSMVSDRLSAAPRQLCMIDDRQYNVDAARRAGLHAIHWRGAEPTKLALESAGTVI